ncbi:MAG: S8 family serine peptidase [Chitinophagales bacterium]
MKTVLVTLLLFTTSLLQAQSNYWVSFKDKAASIYTISDPTAFMHSNALARRNKFNIAIDKSDLPVCKLYLDSVEILHAKVLASSKWLNGALIQADSFKIIENIQALSFVKKASESFKTKSVHIQNKFNYTEEIVITKAFDYGNAQNQISMLNGNFLHNKGFTGSNIDIAIMDNGFPSVDTNEFYQDAFLDGRIIAGYDFVNLDDTLFDNNNGSHGNSVISTMVSFKEGELVGVSPMAKYYLFSTEDNANEGLREEYNWVLAAEMADTLLGVNAILSTSLGYSNGFNNASENHTYEEMDGNSTPITIGADFAAAKGFLVVNSAGNEGDKTWKYITAPADGDSVLAIGAVDKDKVIVNFSSLGPAVDGDVKPNVCAQGRAVYGVSKGGKLVTINGTSFSCPITAGMAACLWQAFPDKTNMEIFHAIEKSAHLFNQPNYEYGFGIPNFEEAYKILENRFEEQFLVYPNPVSEVLQFFVPMEFKEKTVEVKIFAINGKILYNNSFLASKRSQEIHLPKGIDEGVYYINLVHNKKKYKAKLVKM